MFRTQTQTRDSSSKQNKQPSLKKKAFHNGGKTAITKAQIGINVVILKMLLRETAKNMQSIQPKSEYHSATLNNPMLVLWCSCLKYVTD